MAEPLVCKVPECGRTRASASPDFCVQHEFEAKQDADKAVAEAVAWTDVGARFEAWCREHGRPSPLD